MILNHGFHRHPQFLRKVIIVDFPSGFKNKSFSNEGAGSHSMGAGLMALGAPGVVFSRATIPVERSSLPVLCEAPRSEKMNTVSESALLADRKSVV